MSIDSNINKYKHTWLILLLILCAMLALTVEYYLPKPESGPVFKPSESFKLAVESFTSLRQLLISWSFGVVAGIAIFLKANIESDLKLEKHVFVTLIISAILVVVSFFFGHLVLDRLSLLLSFEVNPFDDSALYTLGLLQYIFLLLSIVSIIYAMSLIYIPRLEK